MTTFIRRTIFLLILPMLALLAATGQSVTLIRNESRVTISGTSSLHDWHENAGDFKITLVMKTQDGASGVIEKVSFICKSASVTSDNSLMTDKTHNALQVDKYPEISFISDLPSPAVISVGDFSATVTGDLKLNGVTKPVSLSLKGSLSGDKLSVQGSQSLKMSDFQIKSPTAMLGTLKTGDEVTVFFDLKFDISNIN